MLVQFKVPTIAPDVILKVNSTLKEAKVKFKPGQDKARKKWALKQTLPLLESIPLPKIPSWLHKPIREAAASIIIDTLWALQTDSES